MVPWPGLPAAELVQQGVDDLSRRVESIPALVVSIGAPRLRQLGVTLRHTIPEPEHRLYERLRSEDADVAHSRYNALLRRLVSFERALASIRRRSGGPSSGSFERVPPPNLLGARPIRL